ncbi:MucB/RseB C-terminal domain-containing protein [Kushneria phyllosphaerae]|uniref:Sigma factor AlgU regulatory protein MucB n=1 Tax=Kushneria phyllosphaerae TaxID=2100822 RepID=A0A2R8CP03_9GAMM|nr:MucB/RseB C-terminal domain-containing protein [Kushneria phyllosphaerae]SPJ34641.1 Sigma factor AlgU regulatory protein MucB [Kushneria phyllosphaerae]
MRQWFCASLMGAVLFSPLSAVQADAGEPASNGRAQISCSQLDQEVGDKGDQWFRRSLVAERCHAFQAVALRLGMGSLRTFLFEHRIDDGQEQERIQFLDGPAETIEHQGHSPGLWWMQRPDGSAHLASIDDTVKQLQKHYDFRLIARDVVAGRRAVVLDVTPRDDQRLPHRLWLDIASGLPLRQQLLNAQGLAVDTVQIVRIDSLVRSTGTIYLQEPDSDDMLDASWQPNWLPQGFYRQPAALDVTLNDASLEREIYSDGLATLSIFAGPVKDSTALREGVHQLGNFRAAARHLQHDGQSWQVIAVGAMPASVLTHVVSQVHLQPAKDGGQPTSSETSP